MLKLYVDDINKKKFDITLPFTGFVINDINDPTKYRYNKWSSIGTHCIKLINDISKCDLILYNDNPLEPNQNLINISLKYNKKLLVLFNSDLADKLNIPNSIILRTSMYASNKQDNEYAIPGFVDDIIEHYFNNEIPIKSKSIKPIISFCGYDNHYIRQKAIEKLKQSNIVDSHFIIRKSFWGGATNGPLMKPEADIVRKEFIHNLYEGDYALCVRGNGNFSYRLYEAMSMGKIPIFINTDCVLPFDWIINWKDICVWVEEKDLNQIDQIILHYHNSISDEDFLGKQIICRKIWEEYLSPHGYYSNIFNSLGIATP